MARNKTHNGYVKELERMIMERTGAECEAWLMPQVRACADTMVMLDKVRDELLDSSALVTLIPGSTGQMKSEVNPLLPYYDKLQRTLMEQLKALGLNFNVTPSKVKEDAKKGVDEEDAMAVYYKGMKEEGR